ncbi:RteC domain-containing protein [Myroides odoratimimus]|uniref:RteC domain-containing protein n=1 Tax=Myroides odoratimimus TaxID=76832 RepID=UPI002578519B|nr:RteC domain-containing protein [Myroides odoratimimus]MDM1086778.1 RteC domain-containing protein [Myroides odoratimimus]
MNDYCKEIIKKLDEDIAELTRENGSSLILYEKVINLVLEQITLTKSFILNRGFESLDEEIQFFKHQKPVIVSKLIYYNAIYKIETKKPYGAKPIRKYLNKELKKLKRFFDHNLEFYKYYRSNNSYVDEKFFVRGKHDIRLWLDTFYFEADHRFSTSHDYKVAKIIANDLIQVYIEDQLNSNHTKVSDNSLLNWTASKTALTELIYSLHSQGVFENGNADIKLIAKTFESAFNIDLGDFYHTFMELKARKINRTKFLDSLCEALIKKMEEQ